MDTYKDFLQWLGLSNSQFIIGLIVLFLVVSFIMMLKNLGFLNRIVFKQMTLPKSKFLYKKYTGSY